MQAHSKHKHSNQKRSLHFLRLFEGPNDGQKWQPFTQQGGVSHMLVCCRWQTKGDTAATLESLAIKNQPCKSSVGEHQLCHMHAVHRSQCQAHLTGSKSGWNHRLTLLYFVLIFPTSHNQTALFGALSRRVTAFVNKQGREHIWEVAKPW